ncbi:MAG: signal peptidase I [Methanobacterium sp.]|nr:signal peptidase I [Methanobacterium sp.]
MKLIKKSLKKNKFRFKALGSSMFPLIKNGDLVTIKPVNPYDLSTGDIIFFEKNDSLILHRIIKEEKFKGKFITKGDNMPIRDPAVNSNEILGKLTSIERNGKIINLDTSLNKKFGVFIVEFHWIINPLLRFFNSCLNFIPKALIHINSCLNSFKRIRKLKKHFKPDTIYYASSPDDFPLLSKFYGADLSPTTDGSFYYIAEHKGKLIGSLFVGSPWRENLSDDNWWIMSLTVLNQYKGMGIGEEMVLGAISELKIREIDKVLVNVFEDNKASLNLFKKIGFKDAELPEIEEKINDYYLEISPKSSRSLILSYKIK